MGIPLTSTLDDRIRLVLYDDPKLVLRVTRRVGIFDSVTKFKNPNISLKVFTYTYTRHAFTRKSLSSKYYRKLESRCPGWSANGESGRLTLKTQTID